MVTHAYTVAFKGVDARLVEVQCAVTPGLPAFAVVGLPDETVSEARTIADLDGSGDVHRPHVAEELSFRLTTAA